MDLQAFPRFNFLRDFVLFSLIFALYLLGVLLLIPNSLIQGFTVFAIQTGLARFFTILLDLADGLVCTLILSATLFQYFLWRKDFNIIIAFALFFTGLFLTFDEIFFSQTTTAYHEQFSWFITHLFFTISLPLSIFGTIIGAQFIRIYKVTYIVSWIICFLLLWGVAISFVLFFDTSKYFFLTDRVLFYFHFFESVPFFLYLLITFPLQILLFYQEKRVWNYFLLFSSIPFFLSYLSTLLLPNERYFFNITLNGAFELFGFLSIAFGVTVENFSMYDRLKYNKEQAELLSEAKTNFISSFSTQIRTPLSSVIGYAESLENGNDGTLNEKQKETTGQIKTASTTLLQLIDQIIDISQIEAGKISYSISTFSLNDLCQKIIDTQKGKAQQKGLELRSEIPEEVIAITTDEMRIKQVLHHLVENGIRYTDSGSVILRIEPTYDKITITVTDTGRGIPRAMIPNIFRPFTHISQVEETNRERLGIGLSIVQLIAHSLKAELTVTSKEGEGTTFYFSLPRKHSSAD